MDAGPDALRISAAEGEPPLGAIRAGDSDLGPISPELALVDPVLAERARELLPEPRERPRPPRPVPATAPLPEASQVAPAPGAPPQRRRWPRTVALAVLIFAAGAASGSFLGSENTGSPGMTLEVRATAPTASTGTGTQARAKQQARGKRAALRPPKVSSKSRRTRAAVAPRQRRRKARVAWAANVLGVAARVDRPGVVLVWRRPAGSGHVVVLRARENHGPSVVVYRGRATSYHDSSPRSCTAYRYTIVNYDRRGHRSTGVPTSIVTKGCT